jgi:hypothetical protein
MKAMLIGKLTKLPFMEGAVNTVLNWGKTLHIWHQLIPQS